MKKSKEAESFGVIGLGRFGMALATTLAEAGKDVIVIDKDECKVKEMRQYTEFAYVADNLNAETLEEIGIQNCDVVVVCIGEKIDTSILTTMHVVSLGVPHVIAKATSYDQGAVLKKIGAEVVYPERDVAVRLGKRLISSSFLDFIALDDSVEIRQIKVSQRMVGESIQELDLRRRFGLNIIAICHGSKTDIEVQPSYRLSEEDAIVVVGKVKNIDRFTEHM
ncbi:MAG TPA: TrkA family potassium uptake protein [Candidatus Limivivens intestinipullorum]|uniref:TrkA family potassium uptake protein n=1 Tax=Candidatus Limivivens intestinipullorum TaxID=2840858 RepID=A0A9D1ETV0_9FIRM|nr:TrkA family potassium uptake protein [Candidatus Limivivens intestinipullorum]